VRFWPWRGGNAERGIPFAIALASVVALAAASDSPERVFRAYIAARNRHDPGAILALTSPEVRAFDAEGKPHPYDPRRVRDVIAWEGGMHARWKGRVLARDGAWLEVEASEENDLDDALGVGAVVQRDRLRVEGGKILEWRGLEERSTGREEGAAISEFKRWIESLPAELRVGALNNGQLLLNRESAGRHAVLIRRWREERSRPK